jgi:uncharacterized protein
MSFPPRWAAVTGASSGLGAEYARQLASQGHSIVLISRDQARLVDLAKSLRDSYAVEAEVLVADLHQPNDRALVKARLRDNSRPIRVLVNNAGYGIAGDLATSSVEEEGHHLTIHVTTPLELTQAVLPGMIERGEGRVIIVSSVAGYLSRGTYSAHKAWGLSLARSLHTTYRAQGVHVSAVAPGFTRTEFHQRMGMGVSGIPGFMWLKAPRVVSASIAAVELGKAVVIPSLRYKALVALAHVVPRKLHQGGV